MNQDGSTLESPTTAIMSPMSEKEKGSSENAFPFVTAPPTMSGRPDVPAILQEEISKATSPVSVDGEQYPLVHDVYANIPLQYQARPP